VSGARRRATAPCAALLTVGLLLAGCGGSSSTTQSSTAQTTSAKAPPTTQAAPTTPAPEGAAPEVSLKAALRVPLHGEENLIDSKYTCDGADVSPPLQWTGVPASAAEVGVFAVDLQPVHGRLAFDWAVLGLSPKAHGVAEGKLPASAVAGRNSTGKVGYSFCPPRGQSRPEHMIIRIIALKHRLAAKSGFDAEKLFQKAEAEQLGVGLTGAGYKRS
jgi:phosphatidylethanolamine-binding protein (PEBP) family uncharacterized protein